MTRAIARAAFPALLSAAFLTNLCPANAADGYEMVGFGVRQRALGGADIADPRDAMSMAVNPAGAAGLSNEFQFGITGILPERGYRAEGLPLVLAPGDVRSGGAIFPAPNAAYLEKIDADSSWGLVTYGHSGDNVSYDIGHFKPPLYGPAALGSPLISPSFGGPLGGGAAGLDLREQIFSVVYARKFGPLSIGVAPSLSVQAINVQGLGLLAPLSSNPSAFSNRGYDWAVGGGVRVGMQYSLTPQLRVAVAGATPMFGANFSKYAGLLAERGNLDIPAHVTAGVAYDVLPELTMMLSWKHIFYGSVPALANASFPIMPGGAGSFMGPGFGLHDTDSGAVGAEWRASPRLTLRAGYHYSTLPFGSRDVTLNVLAPGVSQHHVTGGFNFKVTDRSSIDVAALYAFKNTVSGNEAVPYSMMLGTPIPPFVNPAARVSIWLRATEISLGYNYKFDADAGGLLHRLF